MDPDSIIGARMGVKVHNPEAQHTLLERTREMRGENLRHQYLYETAKQFLKTRMAKQKIPLRF